MRTPRIMMMVSPRVAVALAVLLYVTAGLAANFPTWWTSRGVLKSPSVAPDDYAALNQGQLKNIALAAFKEFEMRLPGGAGTDITLLIDGFTKIEGGQRVPKTTPETDDFSVVSLGQLKAVAAPFYKRFAEVYLDGAFPWPVHVGLIDDFAVANVGQAKALFGFDFSLPIAIPAPNPVQIASIGTESIQFSWTAVPGARSYRVERREPYVFTAANRWGMRATVSAPTTSLTDTIAGGAVYAYRVIAITPIGQSKPSRVALSQTGPDSDGDGVPDFVEGDGDSDGDSIPDKLEVDSDNDGLPDAMELAAGTNPKDPDTDHDGTLDGEDYWPANPRRSKSLPVTKYAAIDLSKYTYVDDQTPVKLPPQIADIRLNDANEVLWLTSEEVKVGEGTRTIIENGVETVTHPELRGQQYTLTKWKDGEVTKTEAARDEITDTYQYESFPDFSWHEKYTYSKTDYSLKMRSDGKVFGERGKYSGDFDKHYPIRDPNDKRDESQVYRGFPNFLGESEDLRVPDDFLLDPNVIPPDNNVFFETYQVRLKLEPTIADLRAGAFWYVAEVPSPGGGITQVQRKKFFRADSPSWSDWHYITGSDDDSDLWLFGVSEKGHVVLVDPMGEGCTISETKVGVNNPTNSLENLGLAVPKSINDDGWVVGSLRGWIETDHDTHEGYEVGNDGPDPDPGDPLAPVGKGELGFVWNPAGGVVQTFHDLLPLEYKKMIRNAVPYLVTNVNPDTGYPSIAFTADVENGVEDGRWIYQNMILEWIDPDGAGGAPPKPLIRIASMIDSSGVETLSQFFTLNRSHVGIGGTVEHPTLLIPFEFVALDADGNPTDEPIGMQTSMPSPVVDMQCSITDVSRNGGGQITGKVKITGSVKSDLCDTMPAPDGQIDNLELYVNDGETPFATIPLTVTKGVDGTFGKPYPYLGTLVDRAIENVPLTEGVNVLRFATYDKVYGNPGYCEWRVDIKSEVVATGTPAFLASVSATTDFSSVATDPQGRQMLTVAYQRGSGTPAAISLIETFAGSGILEGANGSGVTVSAQAVSSGPPDKRRTFVTTITDTTSALSGTTLTLSESGFNSGQFNGSHAFLADANGQAIDPPPPPDGDPGTELIIVEGVTLLKQSTGGEFHPFVVRAKGPGSWAESFDVKFKDSNITSTTMFLGPGVNNLFLKRVGTNHPLIFTCRRGRPTPAPVDDSLVFNTFREIFSARTLSSAPLFLKGFAIGLGIGGYRLVADTISFVEGGLAYLGNGFLMFGCFVRIGIKGVFNVDANEEWRYIDLLAKDNKVVDDGLTGLAKFMWEMAKFWNKGQQAQLDLVIALLTGDDSKLEASITDLSEMHRQMFSMGAEVIKSMWESITANTDWENKPEIQGELIGRAIFEIASLFLDPEVIALELAKLTKFEFLGKLMARPFFKEGGVGHMVAEKIVPFMNDLAKTKMCFVAGTPVWTKDGLRSIEKIKAGDYVMSRDEFSGQQCYKPVLQTFVTHPTTLIHVRYEALSRNAGESGGGNTADDDSNSAPAEETLVCTPQHPFYVANRENGGFVEAGRLRRGDQFRLVDGSLAELVGLEQESAIGAQEFTTYNFEVQDFHTYFVGREGVWVHNWCEKLFSFFNAVDGNFRDLWKSFDWVLRNPGTLAKQLPSRWKLRMLNEVRRRHFSGEAGTTVARWNEATTLAAQKVGRGHNADVLAENMATVYGFAKPTNEFTPHHIVMSVDAQTPLGVASRRARAVLDEYHIDINDAANGVFVPNGKAVDPNIEWDIYGPRHRGNHPEQYMNEVANRLEIVAAVPNATAADIRNELQRIALDIVELRLPIHNLP
jgi:hypothetical protein